MKKNFSPTLTISFLFSLLFLSCYKPRDQGAGSENFSATLQHDALILKPAVPYANLPSANLIAMMKIDHTTQTFISGTRAALRNIPYMPANMTPAQRDFAKQKADQAAVQIMAAMKPLSIKFSALQNRADREYIFKEVFKSVPIRMPDPWRLSRSLRNCEDEFALNNKDCSESNNISVFGCFFLVETIGPYLICLGITILNTYQCFNAARRRYESCLPYRSGTFSLRPYTDRNGGSTFDPNAVLKPREY